MDIYGLIKPDKKVLGIFLLLLIISVIVSFFIKGSPGYICQNGCFTVSGIGLPFAWGDLLVAYPSSSCQTPANFTCPPGEVCTLCPAYDISAKEIFDPINFVLDIIILYTVALLIVRIYDKYFRKKRRK